jgi:SSS family solute:Na+ symporter
MFRQIEEAKPGFVLAPGLDGAGQPWNWGEYSAALVVSIIGFSCWPHLFMKAFTAKRERTLRQTVVLYPTFKIFLVPILMIGFAGVLFPEAPESPGQILPFLLMSLDLPAIVVGLFCAGALAASMSSGDTMSHATASIVVRDGFMAALGRSLSEHAQRRLIRVVLVVVMAASYVVAILSDASLVDLLLKYSYGPIVQFAPPLFAALYLRRASRTSVLAGLVVGIVVNSVFLYGPDLRPWELHAGLYGLVANAATLALVTAIAPADPRGDEAEFLAVASTPSD